MKNIFRLCILVAVSLFSASEASSQQGNRLSQVMSLIQSDDRCVKDMVVDGDGNIHVASVDISARRAFREGPDISEPLPSVVYDRVSLSGSVVTEVRFEVNRFIDGVRIGIDGRNRPFILHEWHAVDAGLDGIVLFDSSGAIRTKVDRLWIGIPMEFTVTRKNDIGLLSPQAAQVLDDHGSSKATRSSLRFSFETINALPKGYLVTTRGIVVDRDGIQRKAAELLRYSTLDDSLRTMIPEREVRIADIAEASVDGIELQTPISIQSGSSLLFFSTVHNTDGSLTTYRVRFDERGEPVRSLQKTTILVVDRETFARYREPIHFGAFHHDKKYSTILTGGVYLFGATPEGSVFYETSATELKPIPRPH